MENKKIKWLIYTVMVGLIPIILRSLVWFATKNGVVEPFNAADFVAFGLVLHISNINEIEHLGPSNMSWKTIQNGISIVFISFYSALFSLTLLNTNKSFNVVDPEIIKNCAMVLSFISLLLSYAVYHRINKLFMET